MHCLQIVPYWIVQCTVSVACMMSARTNEIVSASRPRSDASYYSAAEPRLPSGLAMWSATNPGDYGASLRDSTIFRRPMSSGNAALDR